MIHEKIKQSLVMQRKYCINIRSIIYKEFYYFLVINYQKNYQIIQIVQTICHQVISLLKILLLTNINQQPSEQLIHYHILVLILYKLLINYISKFIHFNMTTASLFFIIVLLLVSNTENSQIIANVTVQPQAETLPSDDPLGIIQISSLNGNTQTNIRALRFDQATQKVYDFNQTFDGVFTIVGKSSNQDCILIVSNMGQNNNGNLVINNSTNSTDYTNMNNQTMLMLGMTYNQNQNQTTNLKNSNSNNQTMNLDYYTYNSTNGSAYMTNQINSTGFINNETTTNHANQTFTPSVADNQTNQNNQTIPPVLPQIFMIQINFQAKTFTQIKNIPYGSLPTQNSRFVVGSKCQAYSIDNSAFFYSSKSSTYEQVQITQDINPVLAFDNTLTHLVSANALYSINQVSKTYDKIVTLNTSTQAFIYFKGQKLIVHSTNNKGNATDLSVYTFYIQNGEYLSRGNFTKQLLTDTFYKPSVSSDLNYYFLQAVDMSITNVIIGKWISYIGHNTTHDVSLPSQLQTFLVNGYFDIMVTQAFLVLTQAQTKTLYKYLYYFILNDNNAQLINMELITTPTGDTTQFMKAQSYQSLQYFSYSQNRAQSQISKTSFAENDILVRFNTQQNKYYITSQFYPRSSYVLYLPQNNTSVLGAYNIDLYTGVQQNFTALGVPGNWNLLAAAKETLTCVIAYQKTISSVVIGRNNFQTAQINQLVNITSQYLQSNATPSSLWHAASDCLAFAVDKSVYVFNNSTLSYQKATVPTTWNPVQFDESLKYGIGSDGKLGVYNISTNIYDVVNVTGLETILLSSYNATSYLQIFAYQNKILLYTKYDQSATTNISIHMITVSNNTYTLAKSYVFKRPVGSSSSLISFTLTLSRVLIFGNDLTTNIGTGKGFYFDTNGSIVDIIVSPQFVTLLANNPLDIQTSDLHVYVRTLPKNSTDTSPQFQAFYKYQGKYMLKIGERSLTPQNSQAWQKTLFIQSNSTQNYVVYADQFNYNGIVSLYGKTFTKPFTIPNTLDTLTFQSQDNILQAQESFKWLYSSYNQTLKISNIQGYQLDFNQTNYRESKIIGIEKIAEGQYSVLGGTQESQDCAAIFVHQTMAVELHQLVQNGTNFQLKLFQTVTQYFMAYYAATGKNPASYVPRVDIARGCTGFTIDNLIFRYYSTVSAFVNTTIPDGFKWRSMDESFDYVEGYISGGSNSMRMKFNSTNNSYYQMTVDTNNQIFQSDESQSLTLNNLTISSSWTFYNPDVSNVLLVQYQSSTRKSVAIFRIVSNSLTSSLSLLELLSIQNTNARLYKSQLLTKIILGAKNSSGYTAHIRSYDYTEDASHLVSVPQQLASVTVDLFFDLTETHMYANNFVHDSSVSPKYEYFFKFVNTSTEFLSKNQIILLSGQTYKKALIANVDSTSKVEMVLFSEIIYQNTIYIVWYEVPTLVVQQQMMSFSLGNQGILLVDGILFFCSPNCFACNSGSVCIQCVDNFYLSSNQNCQSCALGCRICQNNTNCTTCVNGYFLQNTGLCMICDASCLTCSGQSTNCTSCKVGQTLNVTGNTCVNCPSDCLVCSSTTNCSTCKRGFAIKSALCVQCLPGCSQCDPVTRTTCVSCGLMYYLNGTTCSKCSSNCVTCTSSSICTVCDNGYKLNNTGCVTDCIYPCLTCTTGSSCLSCYGGYVLNSTTHNCLVDLSCNSDLSCTGCTVGYALFSDNSCQKCDLSINCTQCSQSDTSLCVSCQVGFYLQTGACLSCPVICKECQSISVCSQCSSGYYLNTQTSTGYCLVCVSPCLTCSNSADSCQSCLANYTLSGFKCIKNDRAEFQIRLGGNLTNFFTNMDQFRASIMSLINRTDTQAFTFTSIFSGSVVAQGSVASGSSGTSSATSSALKNAIATGSSVGGFSVESATFTSTSDSDSQSSSSSSSNVGLIVGIIIGVIALIIIIIVIVYFCNESKNGKQNVENKYKQSKKRDLLKQKNNYQMQQVKYPYKAPSNSHYFNSQPLYIAPVTNKNKNAVDNFVISDSDENRIDGELISEYVQSAQELQKQDPKNPKRPYL